MCVTEVWTMTTTQTNTPTFPPEIWLQITWHLDLPDLDSLAATCHVLRRLTRDPALHRVRLLVFTPERVSRSLFSINRPSLLDLVHWNIMRGLNIERRWRAGQYLYSTLVSQISSHTARTNSRPSQFANSTPLSTSNILISDLNCLPFSAPRARNPRPSRRSIPGKQLLLTSLVHSYQLSIR